MATFNDSQVMVTLAALAYVAPIPGDGHSVEEEAKFMLADVRGGAQPRRMRCSMRGSMAPRHG
jgi:hypothetical protein